jgi:hypothetical protein
MSGQRGDRDRTERKTLRLVCAVCGSDEPHKPFGPCYEAAMEGRHNQGKLGRETIRR